MQVFHLQGLYFLNLRPFRYFLELPNIVKSKVKMVFLEVTDNFLNQKFYVQLMTAAAASHPEG